MDPDSHELKVCDFGSAKRIQHGEVNVSYICSRYYRAPELIFGATNYGNSIDVWSVGCVIAELLLGQPLFPGDSGVDQLVEIIKILGTPTREEITSMNQNYTEFRFPQIKSNEWDAVFNGRNRPASKNLNNAIDLIGKLLKYKPNERLTPMKALRHQFFDDLRNGSNDPLPNGNELPKHLFQFSEEEINSITPDLLKALKPKKDRAGADDNIA